MSLWDPSEAELALVRSSYVPMGGAWVKKSYMSRVKGHIDSIEP